MKLYSFSISHYCEKARWFLEYKGLPFEEVFWVPGAHLLEIKKRKLPKTYVPILEDGSEIIQGSNNILSYLEEKYPDPVLVPKKYEQEILDWEAKIDRDVGYHFRRVGYDIYLTRPDILTPLMLQENPSWMRIPFRMFFPFLEKKIRKMYKITPEKVKESESILRKAIQELDQHFETHSFLVGETFTAADITLAALLGPLIRPANHLVRWPREEDMPEKGKELVAEFMQKKTIQKALESYEKFRHPAK